VVGVQIGPLLKGGIQPESSNPQALQALHVYPQSVKIVDICCPD
jgi:hypothetical protein